MQISKVTSELVQVLPNSYDKGKQYPLIIHAHGQGGQHSIDLLFGGELPEPVKQSTDAFGFIVLAPWTPGNWDVGHYDRTIAYAKANLPIDWKRVYLMGLSLGGQFVTKALSTNRALDVAATAVACGVNNLTTGQFVKEAGVGCVFFHATNDSRVGVSQSRTAVKTINDTIPLVKAKMVEYPDGDHYIWGKAFSTELKPWLGNESPATVYDWLLMNTTDKSVEVPITTTPTGLTAKAAYAIKDGQIHLDGTASTGYDSVAWTDKSAVKSVWVGGTGWKTAISQPKVSGTYVFELKVGKAGIFVTDTITVTFGTPTPPTTKTVATWSVMSKIITFSDGSTEPLVDVIEGADKSVTLKTSLNTYKL